MWKIKLFDYAVEEGLAQEMADHLLKNISPKQISERRHTMSANKITRILEQIVDRPISRDYRGGIVRRSILAHKIKWKMLENGYPKDFVELTVEGLIVKMQKKP